MENNSKTILALLVGAAAGLAVGYFLASDNKDEIIADIKDAARKVKDNLDEEIEKGKKLVDDVKTKVSDLLDNA